MNEPREDSAYVKSGFLHEVTPRGYGGGGHWLVALLCSLVFCGAGQLYNGQWKKGVFMVIAWPILWFILLGWAVHLWSLVDAGIIAYRRRRDAKRKLKPEVADVFE